MTRRAVPLAALLGLLSLAPSVAAQEISGIAIDEGGRPLPEVPVALHRIGGTGGATVDASTTDSDGRFRFRIEPPDSALYFVAIRHGDQLFIGPPARAGGAAITDYRVVAEPAAEAGAVATALSGGTLSDGALTGGAGAGMPSGQPVAAGAADAGMDRLAWIVALLALAAAAMFVTAAPGYRERQRRGLLTELAVAERAGAGMVGTAESGSGSQSGSAAESERERREAARRAAALRQRLAPRS